MAKKVTLIIFMLLMAAGITYGVTGRFQRDSGQQMIPFAGSIVTQDAAATPVVSPKTTIGVTPQSFKTPANAIYFIFRSTAACRYGDNSTLDGGGAYRGYKKASAGGDVMIPCSGISELYIRAESGTVDVDFHYEVLAP